MESEKVQNITITHGTLHVNIRAVPAMMLNQSPNTSTFLQKRLLVPMNWMYDCYIGYLNLK